MNKIIHKYSNEFYDKLYMCYITGNFFESTIWIYSYIMQNKSLEEIAQKYINSINCENDPDKLSCWKLFDAFLKFKQNIKSDFNFDKNSNSGIISYYELLDSNYKFKIIFLTVEDLIKEMDGEYFFNWIDNINK